MALIGEEAHLLAESCCLYPLETETGSAWCGLVISSDAAVPVDSSDGGCSHTATLGILARQPDADAIPVDRAGIRPAQNAHRILGREDRRASAYPVSSASARCGVGMAARIAVDHGSAGLPAQLGGVPEPVRVRRGVSALSRGLPLAGRVPLPGCGDGGSYPLVTRDLLQCRACRRQTSVTAGTVLDRTRLPLPLWFAAAYLVTTHTPGFSALQLQRQLGLGRYETAWTMLQKLRRAMVRPERDRLSGTVELDETYVGGVEEGRRGGRQRDSRKAIVAGAVEVRGHGSGRIRLTVVPDLSAATFARFAAEAITPGSIVLTDGWHRSGPWQKLRPPANRDRRSEERRQAAPRVHRAFANLKTWLLGTHHGVGAKHLPHYIDEFVFRFNRRRTPMAAFQSLLGLTTRHTPTTYQMLYAAEPTG